MLIKFFFVGDSGLTVGADVAFEIVFAEPLLLGGCNKASGLNPS